MKNEKTLPNKVIEVIEEEPAPSPDEVVETPRHKPIFNTKAVCTPPEPKHKVLKSLQKSKSNKKKKKERVRGNKPRRNIQRVTVQTEVEISPVKENIEINE